MHRRRNATTIIVQRKDAQNDDSRAFRYRTVYPREYLACRFPAYAGIDDACGRALSLQHGLKLPGRIGALLVKLGYEPQPVADSHLCCGSAGAYSLLQPAFANPLKTAKLAALNASAPAAIYTANIGCWMHLADGSPAPVRHWIEAVDAVVTAPG